MLSMPILIPLHAARYLCVLLRSYVMAMSSASMLDLILDLTMGNHKRASQSVDCIPERTNGGERGEYRQTLYDWQHCPNSQANCQNRSELAPYSSMLSGRLTLESTNCSLFQST